MIHRKIREARLRAGLTHQEVADRLGLDRTAVVKWETGKAKPGVDRLRALADLVRVPPEWFLDDADPEPPPMLPARTAARIERVRTLGQIQRIFWDSVPLPPHFVREVRVPGFARTIAPDIMSEHYAIECAVQPRPYYHQLAQAVARVHLACTLIGDHAPALMLYIPPEDEVEMDEERERLHEFPRVVEKTRALCDAAGVKFFVVRSQEQASWVLQNELR